MTKEIKPEHANSRDGGEVYRLTNMVGVMDGDLPNHITLFLDSRDVIVFRVEDDGGTCDCGLKRSQVEWLRDQLMIWLGESK